MVYIIKQSKVRTWGYEIVAKGYHNIVPSIEDAIRLLQNRFGPDVKFRVKDEQTKKGKSISAMAEFTEILSNPTPDGEAMAQKVFDFLDARGKDFKKAELLNIIKEFVNGSVADLKPFHSADYPTFFKDIAIKLDEKYENLY